ncbi:MAG TPA: RHS repeat-associated core domain-containing protein, partial [Hanamia sp.]|nr:RHS repeat-associated core domain-containing protein [Hanamia sp.]
TDNNVKASATTIQSTLSNVSTSPLNTFLQQERPTEPQTSAPRGYLNIIFFDEQFNYVNSYFMRVSTACDASRPPLTLINEEALKNGWCYIYLSDESDEPVYFDNFQVAQTHGRIIEENHYYSYGLKINGINSQAVQPILNNYGYQGDYSENNAETSLDEFELRHYDPQTGRWTTTDPYEQYPSPYTGLANNPVSYIDPDGGGVDEPNPWIKYKMDFVTYVEWYDDYFQGEADLMDQGATDISSLGDEADWVSNMFGIQYWHLMSGGEVLKEDPPVVITKFLFPAWKPGDDGYIKAASPSKPSIWQNLKTYSETTPTFDGLALGISLNIANDAYITGKNYQQGHTGWLTDLYGNSVGADDRLRSGMNTFQLAMAPTGFAGVGGTAIDEGFTQIESKELSTIRYTQEGETFMRYESANKDFSHITQRGGVIPETYAAPSSDGIIDLERRISVYNLPGKDIPRPNTFILKPPVGTPIIGPRPVAGGTGNEVFFPFGF